jgi:F0F1-type ATP synthase beta subunit|tara:strand:+ start:135 stop:497 length:363 start_codon:yes stop_codon:yes gene_type:complete
MSIESVNEYESRLRERVGEGEYERHKELVRLLARNLAVEDVLWEEIIEHIKDIELRSVLLKQRNQIVRDIHTEFRALNIEIPTIVEKKTESFMSFLGDLSDDENSEERNDEAEERDIRKE